MSPATSPTRLKLQKDRQLEIDWQDGTQCVYPLTLLRAMCPCAQCKGQREQAAKTKSRLTILPGNYMSAPTVTGAEKVGNYALKLTWSDQHDTGIYSFEYLRSICPAQK